MMYFGWIIWIFSVFMNQIVLFNFLIAIISKSYDNVMTQAEKILYKARIDHIIETALLHSFINRHLLKSEENAFIFTLYSADDKIVVNNSKEPAMLSHIKKLQDRIETN